MEQPVRIEERKTQVTKALSDHYAQNLISLEEYERLIDYVNKVETSRELSAIESIIQNHKRIDDTDLALTKHTQKHITIFSWRSATVKPIHGNAGTYLSLFGTNRIIIHERDLPKGKTVLHVSSIFGLTEILVSKNIRIINRAIPILAGIFMPGVHEQDTADEVPELYITGNAIFGNITIKTIDEAADARDAFQEQIKEAIYQKIIDKTKK